MQRPTVEARGDQGEVLGARGLSKSFGGVRAVHEVSLELRRGEVVGLIGPNGAGKTTLLNLLSGLIPAESGQIYLRGSSISKTSLTYYSRAGIVRTFQEGRVFSGLTVRQNLQVGQLCRRSFARSAAEEFSVDDILADLALTHLAERKAGQLSYGDQRRVEIARALCLVPRFLLLDEPAAGMGTVESEAIGDFIHAIPRRWGCGVLLVEHDLPLIMAVCARLYVLNDGIVVAEGTPETVRADPRVISAYTGDAGVLDG